ncbi:MAG: hypothetical protein R3B53_02240 [Candidatus Paceibacterota bacterium]
MIEFLLQTLNKVDLDPRTFKLRAREEVIPYVPLLPNKIDQDHFENVIAEALKTTKDAVHFEVERCIELAQNNTQQQMERETYIPPAESGINKMEPTDRKKSLLTFLLGAVEVLEGQVADKVRSKILEFTNLSEEELLSAVSVSSKAEVIFKAEKFIAEQPKRLFEAEVVHSLNQLYQLVVKRDLNQAKEEQRKAELEGDSTKAEILLKQVSELQKRLQIEPVSVEDVFIVKT